jgi:hypothetical protein
MTHVLLISEPQNERRGSGFGNPQAFDAVTIIAKAAGAKVDASRQNRGSSRTS